MSESKATYRFATFPMPVYAFSDRDFVVVPCGDPDLREPPDHGDLVAAGWRIAWASHFDAGSLFVYERRVVK